MLILFRPGFASSSPEPSNPPPKRAATRKKKRARAASSAAGRALSSRCVRPRASSPEDDDFDSWDEGVIQFRPSQGSVAYIGCEADYYGAISQWSDDTVSPLRIKMSPPDDQGLRKMRLVVRATVFRVRCTTEGVYLFRTSPESRMSGSRSPKLRVGTFITCFLAEKGPRLSDPYCVYFRRSKFVGVTSGSKCSTSGYEKATQIRMWMFTPETSELEIKCTNGDGQRKC